MCPVNVLVPPSALTVPVPNPVPQGVAMPVNRITIACAKPPLRVGLVATARAANALPVQVPDN
jgi:hypothetical protein